MLRTLSIGLLLFCLVSPLTAQTNEGLAALLSGLKLRQANSPEAAINQFEISVAAQNYILNDYAQFELSQTYFNLQDYQAAIDAYQSLAADYPESLLAPLAILQLGRCYLLTQKYPTAIKTFTGLIADFPEADEVAQARFLIAKAYLAQGNWRAAYQAFGETDLYHPLSYFGKQARLEIKALKRTHKKKLPAFKASATALYNKGMTYYEQEEYDMAVNIFNRLAREYPRSKYINEAWLMLGRIELQTNKLDSAIQDLERASRGAPNLAGRANYYLGITYGRRGQYDLAVSYLKKVVNNYPESDLADDAAYWAAYYEEVNGQTDAALKDYVLLINKFPYSSSVSPAIWRIGKIYYWGSDFKTAAKYFHFAQLYPPGEETPRCLFFEAKALERLDNRAAALDVYRKLVERFDHTYYAYRASEKLNEYGVNALKPVSFAGEDFSAALAELQQNNQNSLVALMEIWEESNTDYLKTTAGAEARLHLAKHKELLAAGLFDYAAAEARYLVNLATDDDASSIRLTFGEIMNQSGEYRTPLRFAERKIKAAIMAGQQNALPKKAWQLAYPKAYWSQVSKKANAFDLDPYLVLAVMREESRFSLKATSRSGARGLMQIMPRTGRGIAKDLGVKRYRTSKLYQPSLNIEFGSYYLSNLVKNFGNNVYLSLAGYNGGPNKIKRYVNNWYNGNLKIVDVDEFVESIPNRETRYYVQKVMGSYFEYKRLYD